MKTPEARNAAEQDLRAALSQVRPRAPWLGDLQAAGRDAFEARGLPTRRNEAWKYSDLSRALEPVPAPGGERGFAFSLPGAEVITVTDGIVSGQKSGIWQALSSALAEPSDIVKEKLGRINPQADHPMLGLNTALMEDGAVIRIPAGTTRERAIHLRFVWTGADAALHGHHLRVLVVLEEGAQARILETHEGPGASGLATIVTEIDLAPRAELHLTRMEALGAGARQSAVLTARIGREARLDGFHLSRGAAFSRFEVLASLAGAGAGLAFDGAYLVGEARHNDTTTVIEHAVPHTTSRQMFRGVLAGTARGVFQGRVVVKPGAQQTDAQQQSRAVLLSRRAEIDVKPELEIFADDVKCSHGATAGELDPAALFFMRARGIPEKEARALLVEGFLEQGMEALSDPELRAIAQAFVRDWLDAHAVEVTHADQR